MQNFLHAMLSSLSNFIFSCLHRCRSHSWRNNALLAVCALLASIGLAQAQAPCPPLTTQSVAVNTSIFGSPHPGLYEVTINAPVQHNSYYAYLYLSGNTTPYTSVEVLGTGFDLDVFDSHPAGNYTLKVVPASVNLGALLQDSIVSAPFSLPAARPHNPNQVLTVTGVIDNNIATRVVSPTNPCPIAATIAIFKDKVLGGTSTVPSLQTVAIQSFAQVSGGQCLNDADYLLYLYTKINAGKVLRFRYRNPNSTRDVKAIDLSVDRARLGLLPQIPSPNTAQGSPDYNEFATRIDGLLRDFLFKLLPSPGSPNEQVFIIVNEQ